MVFESNILDMFVLHEGKDGLPGDSKYIWVKYSMYPDGTDLTDNPDGAIYIGIAYNKDSIQESNTPSDYTWSKIKGDDGADAFTVILSNENVGIATTAKNKIIATQTFTSTIQVFQGTTEITDFSIGQIDNLYEGLEIKVENRKIILTANEGDTIPVEYGSYTIPLLIANEIPVYKELTWSLSKQGEDGNPGEASINIIVCNESQNIPCDKDGNVLEHFTLEIPFYAYQGLQRIECSASYGVLPDGMYYVSNESTPTSTTNTEGRLVFNIEKGTALEAPEILTGKIELYFTVGDKTLTRYFGWTKSLQGTDGTFVLYELSSSTSCLMRSAIPDKSTGGYYTLSPESITFTAHYSSSDSDRKAEFNGWFRIEETVGYDTVLVYTSAEAESSVQYTPTYKNIKNITNIKCTLYLNDGSSTLLDFLNVPLISDKAVQNELVTIHNEMVGVKTVIDTDEGKIKDEVWQNTSITVKNSDGEDVTKSISDYFATHEVGLEGITSRVEDVQLKVDGHETTLKSYDSKITQNGENITLAVEKATSALSKLDNKNTTFTEQPVPPYVKGDLWIRSVPVYETLEDGTIVEKTDDSGTVITENVLYQCINTKLDEESFNEADWTKAVDYTTTDYVNSTIELKADEIISTVTGGEGLSKLTQRVDVIEGIVQNPDGTSKIEQNADKIELVVTESGQVHSANIIAAINEDESEVTISADKINLDGYVTFTRLGTYIEPEVPEEGEGGEEPVEPQDTTFIHGGNIQTETINADKIVSGSLTSEQIDVDSLFAGEIDATNANIKNATMTNANMTTATITNANINDCTINSSLNAKNLTGTISDSRGRNSWNLSTGQLTIADNSGNTSINGSTIQTGTIGSAQIDADDLFAQDITATNMTITGSSEFLSQDSTFKNKVEIKNGELKVTSSVNEYINDEWGTKYYLIKNGANGAHTLVGGNGVHITGNSTSVPNSVDEVQSVFFYKTNSSSKIGSINPYGIYGTDRTSLDSLLLDWKGNAYLDNIYATGTVEVFDITVNGIPLEPAFLRHSDNTGYVGLYKQESLYYLRPYAKSKVCCGGNEYQWYDTITERLHVTKERIVCLPSYENTTSYSPNVYVGTTGIFSRYLSSASSRTIKHDIKTLGISNELDARKLYDLDVVQFKYNDGIITDKNDVRCGKELPGFIIEDLDEIYPIAIDKPSDDVKQWTWNAAYLLPPMMKLIQEQHEEIEELKTNMEFVKAENELLKSQLSSILERLEKLEEQN